jgi:hypothetical protein
MKEPLNTVTVAIDGIGELSFGSSKASFKTYGVNAKFGLVGRCCFEAHYGLAGHRVMSEKCRSGHRPPSTGHRRSKYKCSQNS